MFLGPHGRSSLPISDQGGSVPSHALAARRQPFPAIGHGKAHMPAKLLSFLLHPACPSRRGGHTTSSHRGESCQTAAASAVPRPNQPALRYVCTEGNAACMEAF